MSRRGVILIGLVVVCVAVAVGVVLVSASKDPATTQDTTTATALPNPPYMVFRSLDRKDPKTYGRIAVVPLDDLDGPRELGGLTCERVYFQGQRGICMALSDDFPPTYKAVLLGPDLKPTGSVAVNGIPSRARVSPNGRLVSGDSYTSLGVFSTRAMIIDMVTGKPVVRSLESWPVYRDGTRTESVDHNFWGITFAPDGDTFYATLSSGGKTHLVRGSVKVKRMEILRDNVECPSISPDGTRIGFKKRVGGDGLWHLTVLDLATMKETPLAEDQPIDDQVEWLDDDTILYGNGEAIWSVPADGSGTARRFLAAANSPSVVREEAVK